jgi:hypothetical protein
MDFGQILFWFFLMFKTGSRPRSLANVQKQCVEDVKNGRPLDAFGARGLRSR